EGTGSRTTWTGYRGPATTIALVCAAGIDEAVLVKRELSRLWEDTAKRPYKKLFNSSVTATHVWTAVEVMRRVDAAIERRKPLVDGRDRSILVHGDRFVLWSVMDYFNVRDVKARSDFELPFDSGEIDKRANMSIDFISDVVNRKFPDAYPQPLFKNQTKCRELGPELAALLEAA
ncbi:hypothetical protein, partial [Gordonia paraffinivorans]|uniref:hypothetical protein n=1 Tax=Gordonia paraffinivorans TaxID=175628 RepID=UPI00242A598B